MASSKSTPVSPLIGRTFMPPFWDYTLIGGVLSLVTVAVILTSSKDLQNFSVLGPTVIPIIILLSNFAHFAASTVRLYTKPNAYESLPFVTMMLPLVMLIVLALAMQFSGRLAPNLMALYLTWSPYHYAAQAYGLSVMYCYRSGCILDPQHKRLIWWVAMLPFFYNFLVAKSAGLEWVVNLLSSPSAGLGLQVAGEMFQSKSTMATLEFLQIVLTVLAIAGPVAAFLLVKRSHEKPMPLISVLVIVTNGIWFFVLPTYGAFVWATVFHGIQYLAIVMIFHVRDQMQREDNYHSRFYHAAWFYGCCLILAYAMFYCVPAGFRWLGYDFIESVLLSLATINIHHFIVDAYIWRLGSKDSNRRIVTSARPATAGGS